MLTRAIHFVGFRGDEYSSAVKIWGVPDFFHRAYDDRVRFSGEIDWDHDVVVFANGYENKYTPYTFDDSRFF